MGARPRVNGYDENTELVRRWQGGEAAAAEALLAVNAGLVTAWAQKFAGVVKSMTFEDLAQEARLGLLRAAKSFDCDQGVRFSTYAFWWVRQSLQRAIHTQDAMIRLPIHCQDGSRRPRRSPGENLPAAVLSLDEQWGDPDWRDRPRRLDAVGGGGGEAVTIGALFTDWALEGLNGPEQRVMRGWLEGYEQADLARAMGISRTRVGQIRARALARVRGRLREAGIESAEDLL